MRFLPGTSTDSTISHGPFFADRRIQQESRFLKLKKFLWNPEQKTMCNRTLRNWWILLLVYGMFMIILISLFVLSLNITVWYIKGSSENAPHVNRLHIIRGISPGLNAVPIINHNVKLPLIWYPSPSITANDYSTYLNEYFDAYKKAESNSKFVICNSTHTKPVDKLCLFDTNTMGPCSTSDYGYGKTQPCFYLKLNKLQDWIPEYYENDELPTDMPEILKNEISSHNGPQEYIWVHCEGIAPHVKQHIGNFSYYPQRAFHGHFYPYNGDRDFLPPLVAVQVSNYEKRYLLSIHCSVWAKNMHQTGPLGRKTGVQLHFYLDS